MPLMFTGSNYFVFKKEAIDFILTDLVVKRFLEWSKDTLTPGLIMIFYVQFFPEFKKFPEI